MNARLYRRLLLVFGILMLLSAACAMPSYTNKAPTVPAETLAVRTIEAMMTQIAGESITKAPNGGIPANTTPSPTPRPTSTIAPSATPMPTATKIVLPTITATPICDQASFISDVSIPDGTVIPAGTTFVKTWRLKNTGTCAWTIDYAVVFVSGDAMNAPAAINLPDGVMPGDTVDISVTLTAPDKIDHFRGYFKLRNKSGVLFGTGASNEKFYVDIETVTDTSSGKGYNFVSNYCLAQWTGNDSTLACSGHDGSSAGFVLYVSKPVLETGYQDNEPALITNPPSSKDSVIRGKYPGYTVKSGDKFDAIIGCAYESDGCNVRFQLDYQIDNGSIQTLQSWNEVYDKAFNNVNVDLSSLAGKKVKFILTVYANGDSNHDRAQWLQPRIVSP